MKYIYEKNGNCINRSTFRTWDANFSFYQLKSQNYTQIQFPILFQLLQFDTTAKKLKITPEKKEGETKRKKESESDCERDRIKEDPLEKGTNNYL